MLSKFPFLRQDFLASIVVFLVAVPLCVGVAVASGVPAELGLVTGIVGGLVTGFLPGSSLQVSGPAAGLTVLVSEAVSEFGVGTLGVIVLMAGLLQLAMGFFKIGRWFRAISVSVVEGMLCGIGLVIIAGQIYAVAGLIYGITAVVVGSILSMDRKVLIGGFAKIFIPLAAGSVVGLVVGGSVGWLVGIGFYGSAGQAQEAETLLAPILQDARARLPEPIQPVLDMRPESVALYEIVHRDSIR